MQYLHWKIRDLHGSESLTLFTRHYRILQRIFKKEIRMDTVALISKQNLDAMCENLLISFSKKDCLTITLNLKCKISYLLNNTFCSRTLTTYLSASWC